MVTDKRRCWIHMQLKPCDECPIFSSKHGKCLNCQAREVLGAMLTKFLNILLKPFGLSIITKEDHEKGKRDKAAEEELNKP